MGFLSCQPGILVPANSPAPAPAQQTQHTPDPRAICEPCSTLINDHPCWSFDRPEAEVLVDESAAHRILRTYLRTMHCLISPLRAIAGLLQDSIASNVEALQDSDKPLRLRQCNYDCACCKWCATVLAANLNERHNTATDVQKCCLHLYSAG